MKKIYANISIKQEEKKKEVRIYKIKTINYGVEIETEENGKIDARRIENIAESEDIINELLEVLVKSAESFDHLEEYAYDYEYKDNQVI